jgi:hypothetical protein
LITVKIIDLKEVFASCLENNVFKRMMMGEVALPFELTQRGVQ